MKSYIKYIIDRIIDYIIALSFPFAAIAFVVLYTNDMSDVKCTITEIEHADCGHHTDIIKIYNEDYGNMQFKQTSDTNNFEVGDVVTLKHRPYMDYVHPAFDCIATILEFLNVCGILFLFIFRSVEDVWLITLKIKTYKEYMTQ